MENVRHRARFWALNAKIKGVSNGLYCCYGNLLSKKDDHNLFTNVGHLWNTSIVRSWHYETVVVQAALIHQKYKWWKELETIVSNL